MVRFVSVACMLALAGLQVQSTAADGFRGSGRVDCKMSDWLPVEACTAAGSKSQTRYVIQEPSRGGSPCPSTVFTVPCTKKECWMNAWSDWVCDPNTGMKQRSRTIAPGGIQTAKKCPARVERAACDPIACVINSLEEDVGNPWGECKLKGGVWIKTKGLGVKTPAQYGGLCFEPTHPMRKVTATCSPIDCVVTPVELDTGAWGECQETSPNVWTKTKTLGIQIPAQYGGAECSDASRIATASCAQDCQWSATEYDEWTTCDTNNVKYHPFKITQQTAYGGLACPPIEQRADKALCPVDCVMSEWITPDTCTQNPVSGAWEKTSTRTIVTADQNGGLPCGDFTKTDTCTGVDCQFTETPITCTMNADKYWEKTSGGITVTAPELYGGKACPTKTCDWDKKCGPIVDATAKAACTATLAKIGPIRLGYWYQKANSYGNTDFFQCVEKCAAQVGCLAFDHGEAGQSCYLLFENNFITGGNGASTAQSATMLVPRTA